VVRDEISGDMEKFDVREIEGETEGVNESLVKRLRSVRVDMVYR
jgi:hypothetical protein